MVKPYKFEDVVAGLNEVVNYDWKNLLTTSIYAIAPRAPLGGLGFSASRAGFDLFSSPC